MNWSDVTKPPSNRMLRQFAGLWIVFFGGFALALEEAAGNPSRRVGVLTVIDRQRQKIDPLARVGGTAGRDEHDRVAKADDDGAARLFRELAGFEPECVVADCEFAGCHRFSVRV